MILINNNWEKVQKLQDISKIIREYYNCELADELDKLIPKHTDEDYWNLECSLDDAIDEVESLESELLCKEDEICRLEDIISELKEEL